ncbi:MAG: hypothetical protein LBL26_09695, partial [Peptococcaceae bacterium]|nr:hypothetical protein [Peptococcaceae bacterium]
MINLRETLASGQTFAFVPYGGGFAVVADGRPAWVKPAGPGAGTAVKEAVTVNDAAGSGVDLAGAGTAVNGAAAGVKADAEAGLWIR